MKKHDWVKWNDFNIGKLVDWWSNSTNAEYNKRAKCIIEQYGNFNATQIGIKLDGTNTQVWPISLHFKFSLLITKRTNNSFFKIQGENIADNGGIKEAYLAYKNYAAEKAGPEGEARLPGFDYTPEQMFWISWGQVWCAKWTDGKLKSQV